MGVTIEIGYDAFSLARDGNYWAAVEAVAAWVIGCATLALNGVAAFFLYHQLRASQRALSAATEAAEAATAGARPWIRLRVESRGTLKRIDGDLRLIKVNIEYKNIGKTPAVDCQLNVFPYILGSDREIDTAELRRFCRERESLGSEFGLTMFPDDEVTMEYQTSLGCGPIGAVVFMVTYRRPGECRWRSTTSVSAIVSEAIDAGSAQGPIPIQLIRLLDSVFEPT